MQTDKNISAPDQILLNTSDIKCEKKNIKSYVLNLFLYIVKGIRTGF